jgi:nitroreductase
MLLDIDVREHRKPDSEIAPFILERWSPRAMSGEALPAEELAKLFEAARWAPSSMNEQPWRFLYAPRDSEHWDTFLDLLMPGNQEWAKDAAVLMCILSRNTFTRNDRPSVTHSFDTGAAWVSLAFQGVAMGLVVHAMAGFDRPRAKDELSVPDNHDVIAMVAVGKPGNISDLSEAMQAREKPSDRRPISEFAFEGTFVG